MSRAKVGAAHGDDYSLYDSGTFWFGAFFAELLVDLVQILMSALGAVDIAIIAS